MTATTEAPPAIGTAVYTAEDRGRRTYPIYAGTEPSRTLTLDGVTWTLLMVRRDLPDANLATLHQLRQRA